MSKKTKKRSTLSDPKNIKNVKNVEQLIRNITEHRGKHGAIKVRGEKGKKKTKELKKLCMHYVYGKKGKLVNTLKMRDDNKLVCEACGRVVSMKRFDEREVKEVAKKAFDIIDRGLYLMAGTNTKDNDTVMHALATKSTIDKIFKTFINVEELILKRSRNKHKHGKKKGGSDSTAKAMKAWLRR